ncbi:MAG: hypothetical protein ACK559_01375, partial [bacterium]
MQPEPQAVPVQRRADEALGRRVVPADGGPDAGAGGGGGLGTHGRRRRRTATFAGGAGAARWGAWAIEPDIHSIDEIAVNPCTDRPAGHGVYV